MWGNPTREREILLLCFRKVQNSSKSTFPAKENTSQHQICPTEICLVFHAKTVLLSGLFCLVFRAHSQLYGLFRTAQNSEQKTEICLEIRARNFSISVPNPYGLYGSVQYSLPQQKNISVKNSQNFFSWEIVPSLLLTFLSQACSENLSNSPPDVLSTSSRCLHNMSCTLPNAFFYNLKMTFSPQKCLFTFPTLDPKAKIRSCLFQDQGS
jgi:hypothetical protein